MLIELYGENFGCFRDRFELSMVASDIDDDQRGVIEVDVEGDPNKVRLLRCVGIYGPNASGKSTVLKAASAVSSMLYTWRHRNADSPIAQYNPFVLTPGEAKPTTLGVVFIADKRVYEYEYTYDAKRIHRESLRSFNGPDASILFERDGSSLKGEWAESGNAGFELVKGEVRENALLLGYVDVFSRTLGRPIVSRLRALLQHHDTTPANPFNSRSPVMIAERFHTNPDFAGWLKAGLKSADLGINDVRSQELKTTVAVDEDEDGDPIVEEQTTYRLVFQHGVPDVPAFSLERESLGTRRYIELSPILYNVTHSRPSAAAFIDELDASLHPLLLVELVNRLNESNSLTGQAVFTLHNTILMDGEAKRAPLRRDQIYFTDKGSDGAAKFYSLAEFKERNVNNIRRRYLQGRYGAIPRTERLPE